MKTTLRDAAIALWSEAGQYAYDTYSRLRDEHYPNLPDQLPIVIGLTAYGHCLGLTATHWDYGPRISIFSPLFGHGRHRVDDLLIHEMLHARLYLDGVDTKHDSESWYDAVRELSPAVLGRELGIWRGSDRKSVRLPNPKWTEGNGKPKTIVRKARNYDTVQHQDVARWPGAFRPADYDWGKPIPCPTY